MGDYSRRTFEPTRRYSSVLLQQGRVLLDADWNEAHAIQRYRDEVEATDVIGRCGVPRDSGAFLLTPTPDGLDLVIGPGRIWVDGRLCELHAAWHEAAAVAGADDRVAAATLLVDGRVLEAGQWIEIESENRARRLVRVLSVDGATRELGLSEDVDGYFDPGAGDVRFRRATTYLTQPDLPEPPFGSVYPAGSPPGSPPGGGPTSPPEGSPDSPPTSPVAGLPGLSLADGPWVAWLDTWDLEVSALDDPGIREVALGGPDTAHRLKTVWQVRLTAVGAGASCDADLPELEERTLPSTGRLRARVRPGGDAPDLCELPPETGYQRLENQLYRVEVHTAGDLEAGEPVTFKWSRDNAVVETRVVELDGTRISVADLGRDEVLGFAPGQWVEIVDPVATMAGAVHPLMRIQGVDRENREITVDTAPAAGLGDGRALKLRRWDQADGGETAAGVAVAADWMHLEGNVEVFFEPGRYRVGDHWLIPARTATGDIEWPRHEPEGAEDQPLALPPRGIRHHHCRLAIVRVLGGTLEAGPDDCRPLFPPLTDIQASDVGYESETCQLPGVMTVQDALDVLCAAQDLRHHNKYLHGAGVVCGLKVECGPTRTRVVVGEGYGLDCEGYGLTVGRGGLDIPLVAEAQERGLLDGNGNGKLSLGLRRDVQGGVDVVVEAYTEPDPWAWLLDDTLLGDFVEECIGEPFELFESRFTPLAATTVPVPDSQKRLISFLNLLWQLVNPSTGRYVFLSATGEDVGTAGPEDYSEHEFLYRFYLDLQDILDTGTFCGMFDDHPPYPAYPWEAPPAITTAFGLWGFHWRMRMDPNRPLAYTCGTGDAIHVWNHRSAEMVGRLEFPAGGDVQVMDVAVSEDGDRLFAVALLNQTDSVLAVATRDEDGEHTWGETAIVCDTEIVTLATSAAHPDNLYAIGKGTGLYIFPDPENIPVEPSPTVAFNATGMLTVSADGDVAWAAESLTAGDDDDFEQVRSIDLGSPSSAPDILTVSGRDLENDILVRGDRVEVTGEAASGGKSVRSFDPDGTLQGEVPLDTDGVTRLGFLPGEGEGAILVSMADRYEVAWIDPGSMTLETERRIPVQIMPTDVRVATDDDGVVRVVVLNLVSNTLSVIDPDGIAGPGGSPPYVFEPPLSLANYRQDILDAYGALLGELVQYLKDCFCDQFLIDCPECDAEDAVGLACVEIRGERVYRICNLKGREFVKRTQNWEHWLSAMPVLPWLKKAFADFCCSVLGIVANKGGP